MWENIEPGKHRHGENVPTPHIGTVYVNFVVNVLYLSEGELQTGSIIWQREGENSSFFVTVTTDSDPGGVQIEIPRLLSAHRRETLLKSPNSVTSFLFAKL